MSTTNILDLNNRIDAMEKIFHNVEPIQQQIDELKAWTNPGTKDASGNTIILTDGAAFNAVDLKVSFSLKQSGSGTPSPTNVRPITGYTECVVTVKDEDETTQDTAAIAFGQTVYGGSVDFKTGKVTVTHKFVTISSSTVLRNFQPTGQWGSSAELVLDDSIVENTSKFPIASIAKGVPYNDRIAEPTIDRCYYFLSTGNIIRVAIRASVNVPITTAEELLAHFDGCQIVYELATPNTIQLTPAELELLKGYNYITTNGTNIELTYMPDTLKADILHTVSQLYGSKIAIFDGILTGGDTGQVLTKTSDDNYDATWAALPATRTTTKKSEK